MSHDAVAQAWKRRNIGVGCGGPIPAERSCASEGGCVFEPGHDPMIRMLTGVSSCRLSGLVGTERSDVGSRLSKVVKRILRYWTWWRAVLLAVAIALAIVAVAVEARPLRAVAAAGAFGPVAVLLGLGGARVDQHHQRQRTIERQVEKLASRTKAHEQKAAEQLASTASALRSNVAEMDDDLALLQVAVLHGAPAVSLLVHCSEAEGVVPFLDALAKKVVGVEVVVVDATPHRSLAAAVRRRAASQTGLVVVGDLDGSTTADNLDQARLLATGRYLLPVTVDSRSAYVDAVAELVRATPPVVQPWHGWRQHARQAGLVLISATAVRELGELPSKGLASVLPELERLGYVGDSLSDPGVSSSPSGARASTGNRGTVRIEVPAHQLTGRVVLMPQAAYHVQELLPVAQVLRQRGIPTAFMVHDRWWAACAPALAGSTVPTYVQPPPGAWEATVGAFVTMNDWAKHEAPIIETARSYGVPTFGKVEGVQDFHDVDTGRSRRPYQRVAHVLCQGQNDHEIMKALGQPADIVGSARLERIWHEPVQMPERPLVVVNLNFTWGVLEDVAERFLATVAEGCASARVDYVVSMHPSQKPVAGEHPVADTPMSALLLDASVLVSRFSTVPFEAMARGVPFIYHNPHGETIATFANAEGAFDTTTDAPGLAEAIGSALTWRGEYRSRSRSFFDRQISIEPSRSSAERTADALEAALPIPASR